MSAYDIKKPSPAPRSVSENGAITDGALEVERLRDLFARSSLANATHHRRNSLDCVQSLRDRAKSDSTASTTLVGFSPPMEQDHPGYYPMPPVHPLSPSPLTTIEEESQNAKAYQRRKEHHAQHDEQDRLRLFKVILVFAVLLNSTKTGLCVNADYDDACQQILRNDVGFMLTANLDLLNPENWHRLAKNPQSYEAKRIAINISRLMVQYLSQQMLADILGEFLDRKSSVGLQLSAMILANAIFIAEAWGFSKLHNLGLPPKQQLTWGWNSYSTSVTDFDFDSDTSSDPGFTPSPNPSPPRTPERP